MAKVKGSLNLCCNRESNRTWSVASQAETHRRSKAGRNEIAAQGCFDSEVGKCSQSSSLRSKYPDIWQLHWQQFTQKTAIDFIAVGHEYSCVERPEAYLFCERDSRREYDDRISARKSTLDRTGV
jgi:hypothetical protein